MTEISAVPAYNPGIQAHEAQKLGGTVSNGNEPRLLADGIGGHPRQGKTRHGAVRNGLLHWPVPLVQPTGLDVDPGITGSTHELAGLGPGTRQSHLTEHGMRKGHILTARRGGINLHASLQELALFGRVGGLAPALTECLSGLKAFYVRL
jgi:hypothetical protein